LKPEALSAHVCARATAATPERRARIASAAKGSGVQIAQTKYPDRDGQKRDRLHSEHMSSQC
jgi:hypothetical protein